MHAAEDELSHLRLAEAPPSLSFDAALLRTLLEDRDFAVLDGVPLNGTSTCVRNSAFWRIRL